MPDDLSILDLLEEWLEAQVPPDLHDLPFKMLETMERVTNEICELLPHYHLHLLLLMASSRFAQYARTSVHLYPLSPVQRQGDSPSPSTAAAPVTPGLAVQQGRQVLQRSPLCDWCSRGIARPRTWHRCSVLPIQAGTNVLTALNRHKGCCTGWYAQGGCR